MIHELLLKTRRKEVKGFTAPPPPRRPQTQITETRRLRSVKKALRKVMWIRTRAAPLVQSVVISDQNLPRGPDAPCLFCKYLFLTITLLDVLLLVR